MNYILYDGAVRERMLPFTYTKPVSELRIGILTIAEKWEKYLGTTITNLTEGYLEEKFPMVEFPENVFIDASILPNEALVAAITNLKHNELLYQEETTIAFFANDTQEVADFDSYEHIEFEGEFIQLRNKTDLFTLNDQALEDDFKLLTKDRKSQPIGKSNQVNVPENVFIEEGAVVEFAMLNAGTGPIYIGKDALVMEGSMIRGPFAIGDNSVLKMGTKIYGATTIGPKCTVGGEVKNSVFFGNSNKSHEGYLGNSVVGEWCNFGADTNCSNMKNTHSKIKLWEYEIEGYADTGMQFCGLFLGDHCKTGINTMLNTGTVIGMSCHIFGAGFPNKFVPSFSWGSGTNQNTYTLENAKDTARRMYALKNEVFSGIEERIFDVVFELTQRYRK